MAGLKIRGRPEAHDLAKTQTLVLQVAEGISLTSYYILGLAEKFPLGFGDWGLGPVKGVGEFAPSLPNSLKKGPFGFWVQVSKYNR